VVEDLLDPFAEVPALQAQVRDMDVSPAVAAACNEVAFAGHRMLIVGKDNSHSPSYCCYPSSEFCRRSGGRHNDLGEHEAVAASACRRTWRTWSECDQGPSWTEA
jgi:hypothetical protein